MNTLNEKSYGSILFEFKTTIKGVKILGETTAEKTIKHGKESISIDEIKKASEEKLESVFPIKK